jgi:hypothetical protein
VNFLWWVENRQIGQIGTYIRTELWPYLESHAPHLPSWEDRAAQGRKGWGIARSFVLDPLTPWLFAGAATASLIVLGDTTVVDHKKIPVSIKLREVDWYVFVVAPWLVPVATFVGNPVALQKVCQQSVALQKVSGSATSSAIFSRTEIDRRSVANLERSLLADSATGSSVAIYVESKSFVRRSSVVCATARIPGLS